MKKLFSLLLSFSLLFSSVSPSFAQLHVNPRGLGRALRAKPVEVSFNKVSRSLRSYRQLMLPKQLQAGVTRGVATPRTFGQMTAQGSLTAITAQSVLNNFSATTLRPAEQVTYVYDVLVPSLLGESGTIVVPSSAQVSESTNILRAVVTDPKQIGGNTAADLEARGRALVMYAVLSEDAQATVALAKEFLQKGYGPLGNEADNEVIKACLLAGEEGEAYLAELAAQRQAQGLFLSPGFKEVRGLNLAEDAIDPSAAKSAYISVEELAQWKELRSDVQEAFNQASAQLTVIEQLSVKPQGAEKGPYSPHIQQSNQETLKQLQAFIDKHGHWPSHSSSQRAERALRNDCYNRMNNYPQDPSVIEMQNLKEKTPSAQKYKVAQANQEILKQLQAFIDKHGHWPSQSSSQKEERALYSDCAQRMNDYPQDPSVIEMIELKKNNTQANNVARANRETLEQLQAFIDKHGHWPSQFSSQKEERALYRACSNRMNNYPQDPSVIEMQNLKVQKGKVAQANRETLEQLQAFIDKHGHWPSKSSSQSAERALYNDCAQRMRRYPQDPSVIEMQNLKVQKDKVEQANREILEQLQAFIDKHGRWPSQSSSQSAERALYRDCYYRMNNYPQDPSVKEMVKLKDKMPAKQIGRPSKKKENQPDNLQPVQPTVDHTATTQPASVSKRAKRPRISSSRVSSSSSSGAIYNTASKASLSLTEKFLRWQHGNNYIIYTDETKQALAAVAHGQGTDMEAIMLHLQRLPLGEQVGSYNRVIFRGRNPQSPRLGDFVLIQEIKGINKELYDLVLEAKKQNLFPHIKFITSKDTLYGIKLGKEVTAKEVHTLLSALSKGTEQPVRMGKHELGLGTNPKTGESFLGQQTKNGFLHIHFLKPVEHNTNENIEINYTLEIDASVLVRGKQEYQIWKTLYSFFGPYFTEIMHPVFH